MIERVFLDACVLYPGVVRALLLGAAEAGLIQPFWTARVLREWRIAAARNGAEAEAADAAARMQAAWPGAQVEEGPEGDHVLPDPADAHVLAGALAAKAPTLVTFNLRDFPTRRLAGLGVMPRHPDSLLWELYSREPERMRPPMERVTAAAPDARAARKLLRRAGLPRLGKAWEQA